MADVEVRHLSAGINQHGVRDHNERLILSTIQRHGAMPGSDIARMSGLSPQTVSVILRGLEQDGFLVRGDPQRGRVGKPSIPMALSSVGAYSVGLKIGRRSSDLVLTDLLGAVLLQRQATYRYPVPEVIFGFLQDGLAAMAAFLGPDGMARVAGIGVAKPFELWNWPEAIGAPAAALEGWRGLDFEAEIARFSPLPVLVENDATAACRAELVHGRGREFQDFAYFFIGSFIGGGVVLNHSVLEGTNGNAGAFGSLPILRADGSVGQLIDGASLYLLEEALIRDGFAPGLLWTQPQEWQGFGAHLDAWVRLTADNLARAALTVCSVVDFEAVLIDGAFPVSVRADLVAATRAAMARLDKRGLCPPRLEPGSVGHNARALGGAAAPIFARFLLNTHAGLQATSAP